MINSKINIKSSIPSHMQAIEKRFPIHQNNENSQMCSCADYRAKNQSATVSLDRISKTEIDGFPIRVERDNDGKLEATFSPNTHALIIGSTGSGKTTGFVLPFLNWMGAKKNKPTLVISDPKDEIFEQTANLYIKNGYDIIHLDFKDHFKSDCWNPLTKIYRKYQRYLNIEEEVGLAKEAGKTYNSFQGKVYKDQYALDLAIYAEKDRILANVDNLIGSIAEVVSPITNKHDPYWEASAATLIRGFLWAMLEDSAPEKTVGATTEETYSFDTMLKIYDSFDNDDKYLDDHGYFTKRDPLTSKAYQLVVTNIIKLQANVTRSCITSSFAEKMKKFRDTPVRRITSANTFSMDTFDDSDRPIAIFISYKDEDSLHYSIIGLFISDLYTSLIATARRKKGHLERPCYFLLDEFGNFPKFKDFENVISACRSRNIWFFLVVQSYAQLYRVYGKETAEIIIDNLNMHIFYGSCNYETKAAFSKECGMHEVTSALSAINGSKNYIEHYTNELVPLVPISRLNLLSDGECIITQLRGDVLLSNIERSYLCPEYDHGELKYADKDMSATFYDPRYRYDISWIINQDEEDLSDDDLDD